MIKKTMTYENYDGEQITEDFYFNLTKAEVLEMEIGHEGSMTRYIQKIIGSKNQVKLMELFKEIIHKSYGVKTPDGRRFIKNDEVLAEFKQTIAYSDLYIRLSTDADEASAFVEGIMPKDVVKAALASAK